jgi:hypothetical protein
MVINLFQKIAFYGKRVVQVFSVEILLGLFHKHTGDSESVKLRSACPTYHLHDIRDWEIHISFGLSVIIFCAFDYHESGWEINSPGQS